MQIISTFAISAPGHPRLQKETPVAPKSQHVSSIFFPPELDRWMFDEERDSF